MMVRKIDLRRRYSDPMNEQRQTGTSLVKRVASCLMFLILAAMLLKNNYGSHIFDNFLWDNERSLQQPHVLALSGSLLIIEDSDFYQKYRPAPVEEYILNHLDELQLDETLPNLVETCHIFKDPSSTPFYDHLQIYLSELTEYQQLMRSFQINATDLRKHLDDNICEDLKLHPNGVSGLFRESQQLSKTRSGMVEPILPTLRHPKMCSEFKKYLLSIEYMVHDFYSICQQLKLTSRTVFIDMGASLSFHNSKQDGYQASPVIELLDLYRRFGITWDHVYAFELTQQDPQQALDNVPDDLYAAYHWINVGISSDLSSKYNPFRLILDNFNENDLIVVKLDIDTPALERRLVDQLLNDTRLTNLVDHFYFEHHVNQKELFRQWGGRRHASESVFETLDIFSALRQRGVAAHYWP